MRVLLVNTNRMRPPIAPVGLDYVGAALQATGHEVDLLDLCWETDPAPDLGAKADWGKYGLIGLSYRNTDDCYYPGRSWFLPELQALVRNLRQVTGAWIVLGGVGFSVMPEFLLRATGADAGIAGEGEFALVRLANGDKAPPGLFWLSPGPLQGRRAQPEDLAALPPMRRDFVDNRRYYREGGQIGFETKRGCAAACIYCADPIAKGRQVRVRPPVAVAAELAALADQGILHWHTCDAEFNRPLEHALAVCEAIERLGARARWYAYCAPTPFPAALAEAMRRAGCVGINFGADSADPGMLRRLGRDYAVDDLRQTRERCRDAGLVCMFDFLLGGPGETEETVGRSLETVSEIAPDRVGLSVGVRVYPGTALARRAAREPSALHGPGTAARPFAEPAFYLSPTLREGIFPLVASIVGEDPRFFFSDPTATARNYNYSGNDVLVDALRQGYRGAYWDILRRLQEGLPPE